MILYQPMVAPVNISISYCTGWYLNQCPPPTTGMCLLPPPPPCSPPLVFFFFASFTLLSSSSYPLLYLLSGSGYTHTPSIHKL